MIVRPAVVLLMTCVTGACASHEGIYSPACVAFEGSNIELDSGRFVWEKFTDQIQIGSDGNPVEPFPEYPKRGAYRIEESTVYLDSDAGETLPPMHLMKHDRRFYLMTTDHFAAWQETGKSAGCVLTLGGATSR